MPKFRKKPVEVDAVQLLTKDIPGNWMEVYQFMYGSFDTQPRKHALAPDGTLTIETLEGRMEASDGDWIIRGVKGEYYPCKPDIFESTYDPVEA